jgi:hypothetical protein
VSDRLHRVRYSPRSQAKLPPDQRDQYKAVEVTEHLEGTVHQQRIALDYRLIFVWSEAKARQEAVTRQRHVAKIRTEFEAVRRDLGRYSLKTTEAIVRRLEKAKGTYGEGELFEYRLGPGAPGAFQLDWWLNAAALQQWEALEGVYALKTNRPREAHRLTKVLRLYKEQSPVERRIHHLKGPLAVAPMSLKDPGRIAGLLCILIWALMVLALMERQVRRELKGRPMYGLYPEKRPSAAPTGPALLEALSGWCIVIIRQGGTTHRRLAEATPVQQEILKLLGGHGNRLKTCRRRCGT